MLRRIYIILLVQIVAAVAIDHYSSFSYNPRLADYLLTSFYLWALAAAIRSCFILYRCWRDHEESPGRQLIKRLFDPAMIMIYPAVGLQFCLIAWLKNALPHSVGFWADRTLANIGHAIFGVDPWRLLQFLPGPLMDTVYITWAQSTFVLLMLLTVLPASEKRDRALVSFFLMSAVCALAQYLLPSAGPIFYERIGLGERYAQLPVREWAQVTADYLWNNLQLRGAAIGSGISAFPSMHVAGAAWVAIVVGSFVKQLKPLAWAYFVLILLGSVYLGWHYVMDGVAGGVIAWVTYRVALWKPLWPTRDPEPMTATHP